MAFASITRRCRHGALALLLLPLLSWAAGTPSIAPDPLFADDTRIALELEGPIDALVRDRSARPVERPFELRWQTDAETTGALEIEVRPRGKSRRRRELCAFPPLRLNIARMEATGTLFESQDKLKLVTHCERLGSRAAAQHDFVWLEFLAYRFLNVLTERSFRVRAVDMTYVDERGDRFEHPAFLIESRDRLAHRLGFAASEAKTVATSEMDADHRTLMEVFQFLIGNTDFSFHADRGDERCCHNAEQFVDADGTHYPIPYDFDLAGLLNKPDARPAPGHGIDRVIDRAFIGICRSPAEFERVLDRLRERRAEIDGLLEAQPDIRPRKKRLTAQFLERFWSTLEDEQRVRRAFVDACG